MKLLFQSKVINGDNVDNYDAIIKRLNFDKIIAKNLFIPVATMEIFDWIWPLYSDDMTTFIGWVVETDPNIKGQEELPKRSDIVDKVILHFIAGAKLPIKISSHKNDALLALDVLKPDGARVQQHLFGDKYVAIYAGKSPFGNVIWKLDKRKTKDVLKVEPVKSDNVNSIANIIDNVVEVSNTKANLEEPVTIKVKSPKTATTVKAKTVKAKTVKAKN